MARGKHSADNRPAGDGNSNEQGGGYRNSEAGFGPRVSAEGEHEAGFDPQASASRDPEVGFGSRGSASRAGASRYDTSAYARDASSYHIPKKRKHPVLKVLGIILALIVALGAAALVYVNVIAANMSSNDPELAAALDKVEGQEPYYTLLLGSDARKNQSQEESRTDVIILARVDPKTATATLISIPRDTLVDIEGYGANKINSAYTFGGAAGAVNAVEKLMGVNISHYAEINFGNLENLIDVMGGVEVDVKEPIDDPKAGKVSIEAGKQTLNGQQALVFARSRAYANGDYTRGNNQKILVGAIVDKMLSLDAAAMPGVLMECSKCVTTDYTFNELLALVMTFQRANNGGQASGIEVDSPLDAIVTVLASIAGQSGISVSTALQLVWDYITGNNLGDDAPTEVTMYTATVPSAAQSIGGVSYVLADSTALAEMMKLVDAGEDPKKTTISPEEAQWLGDGYNVDESYVPTYDTSPLYGTSDTGAYGANTDAYGSAADGYGSGGEVSGDGHDGAAADADGSGGASAGSDGYGGE